MKWGLWSTTAASNSATPPDGWPEGQLPSTVNDCAREMMAQIRTGIQDVQFIDLGVTPTQTGNTTFTLAGNQMQWYQYGTRVKANVGGTTMYGTVYSSSFTTNTGVTIRFDPGQGPLTTSLSAVATGFPSPVNGALHSTAYTNQNWIINPCMDVWQRWLGTAFTFSSNATPIYAFPADCWGFGDGIASSGPVFAVSRAERSANASNVPTLAQSGVFFNHALRVSVNTALAGMSAPDYAMIYQSVEGYDYRRFAQKPLTVSFWVNSTVTGTYCVALRNGGTGGSNRACVLNYSISSVATWEQKVLTFPKPPSAGNWDYSNGIGLQVCFPLLAGTSLQIAAGAWSVSGAIASPSQTNLASATATFMLTGVVLNEGTQPLPLVAPSYADELMKCQRRLAAFVSNSNDVVGCGQVINASVGYVMVFFPTTLRANLASLT